MQKTLRTLIVLLIVSLLTGCFYNREDILTKKDPPKKQLTLYSIQGDSAVNQVIADSVTRFERDNRDFEVIRELIPNDLYKNRLSVCVATNQMPDVFPTWSGGILKQYIDIGGVVNLNKYMKKDNYSSRFNEKSLKMVTDHEGIWGVPVENMAIGLIFYNKDIFESLNLSEPQTFDQLKNIIKVLKNHSYIPFALSNRTAWTGSMFYMYFVDRLGGPAVYENAAERKNGGSFADPVFVQAGEMVQQLVDMGAFPKGFNWADEDSGDSRSLLYSEKACMTLNGSWFISNVKYEQPDFSEKVGVFPFPSIKGGKGDPKNTIGSLGDNYYSIASSCNNTDEAFELIKYLIDDIAVEKRIEAGKIPPVKEPDIKNPLINEVLGYINRSPNVQFWYDQDLPPKLSEAHLALTRQIFGGEDPKKAAEQMERITRQYYNQ
jgi:raffinose/stachyose/melibiose transport system substrate-binding protein